MTVDEDPIDPSLTAESLWIQLADDGTEHFYDEITGMPLPRDAVLKARSEELADYSNMQVYEEISVEDAIAMTGGKP
eukprot:5608386-Amphidinium_carterae.1